MIFADEIGDTSFTGADRIAADRRASEITSLTTDQFAKVSSRQLADMLDSLNDRLFAEGHENHHLVAEAACRLREY